ncbi:MAG: ABC-F family ATP-binding cassette domain-containing protein [Spirochaetia bacterium]|jgi:ATP-binding cassette subfamily F protein uup|nr:ABC-F family ATP-binding cassette domain-containing protein [Spirochaetia bacterium]
MNLISIDKLSYTMHDNPLFNNISLGIDEKERIGFIGKNGSGKTTFLRLLKGELLPDEGTVSVNSGARIEFLSQHPSFRPGCTLKEYLYEQGGYLPSLLLEYKKCFEEYSHNHENKQKLEKLTAEVDSLSGWDMEKDYISILNELGLKDPLLVMDSLSGGMIKKAAIARVLSIKPDFLILDEPTNHLDIKTIEWLEKNLSSAKMAFIIVTHDRYFLDSVCSTILELENGSFYKYQGNYSYFLEKREERIASQRNEQNRIESILKRELEWLKRGARARTTKDRGRQQRIADLMEKQTKEPLENPDFTSSNRRAGKKILEVKNISKSYDGREVISPFTYSFKSGERIGLVGPNGSGKTTFLDLLTSALTPDSGTLDPGINTKFGYYDQMSRPLKTNSTVLDFIKKESETIAMADGSLISAAKFLDMFGFPPSYHRMELGRLSGGEKRRLYLLQVLSGNPNFLVLDEPTNDLDLETLRKLEEYIIAFKGCVMIVSHDRAFLDRTTDYLFLFDGTGSIKGFTGNYSAYHEDEEEEKKSESRTARTVHSKAAGRQDGEKGAVKKKLTFNENREYDSILPALEKLEK